ncbi:hypothetical protein ZWY2020_023940 [Hordeum vulgare]|nr:hypothetical protein ZWY2020_023940 [Hordeum vulgare]
MVLYLEKEELRAKVDGRSNARHQRSSISWLDAVRSSRSFHSLFHALHPAPLIGTIFLQVGQGTVRSFAPFCRSDPDVSAALRRGDFFLTSLLVEDDPHVRPLLENHASYTYGLPTQLTYGALSLTNHPAPPSCIFSSESRDWVVHPWMEIGGEFSMMDGAAMMVGRYIYQPLYGQGRAITINTSTMDVSSFYLPLLATDCVSMVGDTKSRVLRDIISLRTEIDEITPTPWEWQDQVIIVEVRSGCMYFSMSCITDSTEYSWFFYLSIQTMEIDLLMQGMSIYIYIYYGLASLFYW